MTGLKDKDTGIGYDMIIVRDIKLQLGMIAYFSMIYLNVIELQ